MNTPNPLDNFDPNKGNTFAYATYVPTRWDQPFKVHKKIGAARGAMSNACRSWGVGRHAALYKRKSDRWVEIERYVPPTQCAVCKNSSPTIVLWKHSNSRTPIYKKPKVCSPCYNKHFSTFSPEPMDPKTVKPC